MRNVEGGSKAEKHSRSVSLAASVYCSTQRSRERTQYTQTSSSRVLRIRAARSWVNCSCASPRSALRATSAPRRTKRGSVRRSHRCSWISFPDIFGAPGRGRRGCVNLIQRSHGPDLHFLHRHATKEEDFGGSCSVHIDPTTTGANGWWGRRRRKNGHRRGSPRCSQVQGQGCADLGIRTCSAPISGGAGPTASWYSQCHTFVGPRSSWWISGCSRPA